MYTVSYGDKKVKRNLYQPKSHFKLYKEEIKIRSRNIMLSNFLYIYLTSLLVSNFIYSESIRVMTYNLENLFNHYSYDPSKENYQHSHYKNVKFCSKFKKDRFKELSTKWTREHVNLKLKRISEVILKANPDILFLQEVENKDILNQLNWIYLKNKYTIYHKESLDPRGIDVAILSNLPKVGDILSWDIYFPTQKCSRNILQVSFKKGKQNFTALSFHFPSQRSKTIYRKYALNYLTYLKNKKIPKDHVIIASGDSNIIEEEESALYRFGFLKKWYVSHSVGCRSCLGTYYYKPKKTWSFLDVIYMSKNSLGWKIKKDSVQVFSPFDFQKTKSNTPLRYNIKTKEGVSDHFPLVLEIYKSK